MRFIWPSVVFSLLINLSLQVDGSGQEKQPTSSVQLNARDDESTQELYSIYPKDVTIKSQADAINALLDRVVTNKTSIYASELNLDNTWTLFWNARMTESQADIIRKDPNVGSIGKSSSSYDPFMSVPNTIPHRIQKRNEGLLRQRRAANEMKFISQPYEFPDVFNFDEYVYDRAAGVGITVYISDTGANLTNPEFQQGSNIAQRVRWLFGQGGGNINTDQTDISALGHGTCMLDKVGGNKYGVAKRVNPVIVRAAHYHYDALLDTVRQIRADYDRIYNQDPKHARAIVNLSWGFPPTELGDNKDAWINEIRRELQILVSKGVSIVVPAGNEPFNKPIDKYPQKLAGESGNDGVPEMIVVGGIEVYDNNIGKLYERSQTADYVSVYAPSFKINCANANGGLRIREEVAGTSHASAQVAGLAAYFLSLTDNQDYLHDDDGRQRVIKLKNFIIGASYVRNPTAGPYRAIYNNEDPRECRDIPKPLKDDDDGVIEPCQPSTTTMGNDMTIMGDCFIDTVTPTVNPTPTPELQCSCAGGMVAGVGSTEVMGTTYTWCQTAGPPVYPTGMQTMVSPSAAVAPPSPPEPTIVDTPAPAPEEPAPEKPKGKCNKDDASPLNVGKDC